jgi:hypothetical protein
LVPSFSEKELTLEQKAKLLIFGIDIYLTKELFTLKD